jgi:peptide/nickel transport system substrate-binding protein
MSQKKTTRREFIKTAGKVTAGVALAGTMGGIVPRSAWAKKNSVIVGMTQEPVNFNPLLYVNSGTEEVPEACMFDALWDVNEKGSSFPTWRCVPPWKTGDLGRRQGLEDRVEKGSQVA